MAYKSRTNAFASQGTEFLKPRVQRWVQQNEADLSTLGSARDIETFFRGLGYRPDRPCTIIVYELPFHSRATCSVCLPLDGRLTRNVLEEEIAEDVDYIEETAFAALGLLVFEIIAVAVYLIAKCAQRLRPRFVEANLPPRMRARAPEHRSTVYEATITNDNILI